MDQKAFFKIQYGLFVVTANDNNFDNGCVINTFSMVTNNPTKMHIIINKDNFTTNMILNTKKFNVSILSTKVSFDLIKRFGFSSGKDNDKFKDYNAVRRSNNGLYYLTEGVNSYFSCDVVEVIDLGTHYQFNATVSEAEVLNNDESVTYDYYQKNIKPKPETNSKPKGKTVWRCEICGFEYEADELPDDFICPICKHGKSDFVKVEI